jgi:anti-anti-sigma factor
VSEGRVLHASRNGIHVLRFLGEIRYPLSPGLKRFVDGLYGKHAVNGMVLDLTRAQIIDSTNLGLFAGIADRERQRNGARVTIVSRSPEINEVLDTMGFDEVFDIVHDDVPELPGDGQEVPTATPPDDRTVTSTLLEAHRNLMQMNEQNRNEFEDVVKLLQREETGSNTTH